MAITLADERRVADDSPRSNARLVRETLLRNHAAAASFAPLADARLTRDQELAAANARDRRPAPCPPISSCSAWATTATPPRGFPAPTGLAEAIDPGARALVVPIEAPDAPEPRLTLTGRVILRARAIALQIEGQDKLNTLAEALEDGPVEEMPIRAVLRGAGDRLTIFAAQRA